MSNTYRAGLVGAGNICEFHIRALKRLRSVELIGLTDLDAGRARAVAERFGVPGVFASMETLIDAGADVIHVLTPPASHAAVTLQALARGCHVLVEKPLATSVEDCDRIAEAARRAGKSVGVDHAMLFDPFVTRALKLVRQGKIGDVVAVDYFRSQSYPPYAGGPLPPQYRAGGEPFRDMGVHALYLLEAFLGEIEDVAAQYSSRDGEDTNLLYNEWRALVRCAKGSGQVHLSWNVKPFQNLLLVQGTRGQIRADLFGMSVTLKRARRLPEFVQRAFNACSEAAMTLVQVPVNVLRVWLGGVRRYHGLQAFVAQFYKNLAADRPAPVTPEQARAVVYWTERVARQADRAKEAHLARFPRTLTAPILVTGAGGFIGRHLVARLLGEHPRVRALVRRPTPEMLGDPRLEIVVGDLGDPAAVERAVAGTELVYHLGAACRGNAVEVRRGTVVGTQNVVDSVLRHGARLVHISSLSVLHAAAMKKGVRVAEDWPLEPYPERRGLYTQTKLEAERLVRQAVTERGLRAVILRPGQVFGPGGPLLTPAVGLRRGDRLTILGNGKGILPLVYVEDLVDAILQAARQDAFDGSIYQIVDDVVMTQNDLAHAVAQRESLKVRRLPRWLVYTLAFGVQTLARVLRRSPPLSIYRLRSSILRGTFDCAAARTQLGWRPRIGVRAGLEKTLAGLDDKPAPSVALPAALAATNGAVMPVAGSNGATQPALVAAQSE